MSKLTGIRVRGNAALLRLNRDNNPMMSYAVSHRCLLALGIGASLAQPARAAGHDLSFAELYGPSTADGTPLSPAAQALVGRQVTVRGFMAPPLRAESDFFVLTRYPMSTCPFCSNAADWPVDIVFVRLGGAAETVSPSYAISVSGTLDAGMQADPATGFVSMVRVVDATWRRV